MGINSPHFFSWQADKVTNHLLHNLNRGRNIDVDGNALAFSLYKYAGYDIKQLPNVIVEVLKEISSLGFTIQIIFDNFTSRPHMKRDAIKRRKVAALQAVHASYTKLQLLSMINGNNTTDDDAAAMQSAAVKFSSLVKKKLSLPLGFDDMVRGKIIALEGNTLHQNGGVILSDVLVARFEADHLISKRFIEGASSFIYGVDSDYFALIGSKALLISNFKSKQIKSKSADQSFTISGCSNVTRLSCMEQFQAASITFTDLKCNIFETDDVMIRGLAAVVIGCDVFSGVKNIGPVKLHRLLYPNGDNEPVSYDVLLKAIVDRSSISQHDIETYVHAYLGVTATEIDDPSLVYVWDGHVVPNNLSKYLNIFVHPSDHLDIGYDYPAPVLECGGFTTISPHLYLASIPCNCCAQCQKNYCEHCLVSEALDEKKGFVLQWN